MSAYRRLTHHLHHAAHHFLVALVLASVVLILEYHGMLNWLDSVSLRAVSTLQSMDAGPGQLNESDAPIPLLIGDAYFETAFRQESPLDRRELTRLIGRILQERPSVLAIDLDLSPGPAGSSGNIGQEELDALLVRFAQSEKVPIVLTTPFPVVDSTLLSVKYAWLKKMCDAGIALSYPHIVLSQGLVMRYAVSQPSLGIVASSRAANMPGPPKSMDLCSNVSGGEEKAVFLSKAFAPDRALAVEDLRGQRPISPEYLRHAATLQRVLHGNDIDAKVGEFKGRPVFLGSQFDSRDEFLTPFGPMKGVMIHAATFYSERRPTHAVTHGVAVLLDLVFGVAAGFLFGAVWQRTNAAGAILEGDWSTPRWLIARSWLLAAFGFLFLWLAMLFHASAWLLSHDLWNNPGPMIVGVFVKTLLASRIGLRNGSKHMEPRKSGVLPTLLRNLDWLLLMPFVIWAAILLFGH